MLPFGVTIPATVPQTSEFPEGLMNYPVYSCRFVSGPVLLNLRVKKLNQIEQLSSGL